MAFEDIPFSGAFLDENAAPLSGAAPTITIVNSAGTAVVTGAATTEITAESGVLYLYVYTPTVQSTYTGVMSTSDPDATQSWLLVGSEVARDDSGGGGGYTPEEISDAVWTADNRTLTTSGDIVVVNPLDPVSQLLTIIAGNSYSSGVDDGAIDFTSTDFPVLTGATITFNARSQYYPDDTFSVAGSVIDADTARVQFTAAQTATLLVGLWNFEVVATLSDATVRTLVRGNMNVIAPIPGGV